MEARSSVAVPLSAARRLRDQHGAKALRYCGVSAVNVAVGLSVLTVCHSLLGWPGVTANLSAWAVATVPAYLLSRAWVWQQGGSHRLGGEVLPFWTMALVGLAMSSLAVALVERFTQRTLFVVCGTMSAYGVVWIAKYLFLDQVIWHRDARAG